LKCLGKDLVRRAPEFGGSRAGEKKIRRKPEGKKGSEIYNDFAKTFNPVLGPGRERREGGRRKGGGELVRSSWHLLNFTVGKTERKSRGEKAQGKKMEGENANTKKVWVREEVPQRRYPRGAKHER